jgi:hypothetical protein
VIALVDAVALLLIVAGSVLACVAGWIGAGRVGLLAVLGGVLLLLGILLGLTGGDDGT